jgi:hypothetical protein
MTEETTPNTLPNNEKYTGFYGIKSDLVNVSTYGKEKITFNPERGDIVFFCHDCCALVETDRVDPKKMKFTCKTINLREGISKVERIVSKQTTLPILGNILMRLKTIG